MNRKPIKLEARTVVFSPQWQFEEIATSQLRLNPGAFAFAEDGSKYLNEHMQWLWLQYQKGEQQ